MDNYIVGRNAVKEALKDDGYYRTEQKGSDDENAAELKRVYLTS